MTIEHTTITDTTTGTSTTTTPQTTDSPQSTSKRTKEEEDTLTKDQTAGTIICTNVVNRDNSIPSIPYHCQPNDINENMYNN